MRAFPFLFAVFPVPLWAADIPLESDVSAVTLYPQGATITREIAFAIPQGDHQLILTDLPQGTPLASVRVDVSGARMGSVTTRNDFVPPGNGTQSPAYLAAEAEVDRLELALTEALAKLERIRLEVEAADAQVQFLQNLGRGDGVAEMGVSALRELSEMIGQETLGALQRAHDAERNAVQADRALETLREDLAKARQSLAALVPEQQARSMLAVDVTADAAVEGVMTVTYNTNAAGWTPVYDVALTRETGELALTRGAFVSQFTGENWGDVDVTLSTVRPSAKTTPGTLWPWLVSIYDPETEYVAVNAEPESDVAGALGVAGPQRVAALASFDGISVTYAYPNPVSVASGADRVRLTLGTLTDTVETKAFAVPRIDSTAFLMAEFQNDSGEIILPTSEASFYLDGRFVGQQSLGLIAAGASADLSFGPIEGLRLNHVLVSRNKGDRGVISKSNEKTETVRVSVENLTGQSWPIHLIDHVPYSEQEDLEISWNASENPAETRVDDKQGVLAWEFELNPGATRDITLDYKITWPDGMALQ